MDARRKADLQCGGGTASGFSVKLNGLRRRSRGVNGDRPVPGDYDGEARRIYGVAACG